ncbi:hypothetical protein CNY67_08610 [Desulfovibrio sp. G11]|nr:hypothetical protein CNY67_08610 [Desulfovibrio sp. G11]
MIFFTGTGRIQPSAHTGAILSISRFFFRQSRIPVFFFLLLSMVFFAPSSAQALTWSWFSPGTGVEKLRLHFDAPVQETEMVSAGDRKLIFYINSSDAPLSPLVRAGHAPAMGALVKAVELVSGQLHVELSTQASSIVRRPAPDRLDIEFFAAGLPRGAQAFPKKKPVGGFWSFWPLSEAHAASRESAVQGGPSSPTGRQAVVGKVNTGGPEDWPESRALSTVTQPVKPDGAAP